MGIIVDSDRPRLAAQLLAFYDQMGRPLPWRNEQNLYRIWVSEIMLQQTGVTTVLSYYPRFLGRFPTVQHLAEAREEEVLILWQGLGYYQRARHLHRAAQQIVAHLGGRLPEELAGWLALPGIGPSTAAAILAIGRNQPHTILDGNVKRVLARLMALPHPLTSQIAQTALWTLARSLTPNHRPGDYAQAIMDLGATLCTRSKPACDRCPWQAWCEAYRLGKPGAFPVAAPRRAKPHRVQLALLVFNVRDQLLLCQRPGQGLLANLWEPPTLELADAEPLPMDPQVVRERMADRFSLQVTEPAPLPPVAHTFTHFHLTVYPFLCQLVGEEGEKGGNSDQPTRWLAQSAWYTLPLATLHRKVLAMIPPPHGVA